jgi:hypothetical protein
MALWATRRAHRRDAISVVRSSRAIALLLHNGAWPDHSKVAIVSFLDSTVTGTGQRTSSCSIAHSAAAARVETPIFV